METISETTKELRMGCYTCRAVVYIPGTDPLVCPTCGDVVIEADACNAIIVGEYHRSRLEDKRRALLRQNP